MGRKVNPNGFRLKINKTWDARWYAEGDDYVNMLHQDFEIRELVRKTNERAGVSRVEIERFPAMPHSRIRENQHIVSQQFAHIERSLFMPLLHPLSHSPYK